METISLGIRKLPEVARDQTDRNRTSPFAFTGNKFEFRAVSSAQSISLPIAFLNAAVGEALGEFEDALTHRAPRRGRACRTPCSRSSAKPWWRPRPSASRGTTTPPEWVEEAQKRGLPNLKTSPEALAELVRPEAKEFLARTKVFTEAESDARYHVRMERYIKDLDIEVEALKNIVTGHVLPAAYKQLALLAEGGQRQDDPLVGGAGRGRGRSPQHAGAGPAGRGGEGERREATS